MLQKVKNYFGIAWYKNRRKVQKEWEGVEIGKYEDSWGKYSTKIVKKGPFEINWAKKGINVWISLQFEEWNQSIILWTINHKEIEAPKRVNTRPTVLTLWNSIVRKRKAKEITKVAEDQIRVLLQNM